MGLLISPNDLNRAYFDISESVKDNIYTVLWGGRNSSKSHSMMQWLIKTLWNEPDANAIFYRKFSADLQTKAFDPLKNVAEQMQVDEHLTFAFHNMKKQITFPAGNKVLFDFVEEKGKSKGLSNIRYIIIDEIDQISAKEFIGLITSFRGDSRIRFIFLFNPVSEKHWLKRTFFDNEENSPNHYSNFAGTFHYTIEDNKFATEMDYINLDATKTTDINLWRVNRLGLWGTISVDDGFYDGFDYNTHVIEDKIPFFTNYPLYVFWDFGKSDNALVGQAFDTYDIQSDISLREYFKEEDEDAVTNIAEYISGKAQSNIYNIVSRIVERFGTASEYVIGGDTTGGGSDISVVYAEIRNAFESLGCHDTRFIIRYKPSHKASRRLNNWIMRTYKKNFKISLTDCPQLVEDIQKVRVDENGGINKKDCIAQNIGHVADCGRYSWFYTQIKAFVRRNPYLAEQVISETAQQQLGIG